MKSGTTTLLILSVCVLIACSKQQVAGRYVYEKNGATFVEFNPNDKVKDGWDGSFTTSGGRHGVYRIRDQKIFLEDSTQDYAKQGAGTIKGEVITFDLFPADVPQFSHFIKRSAIVDNVPPPASVPASVPAPPPPVSIDDQMRTLVWNMVKQCFTECGDSYYAGVPEHDPLGGIYDMPNDFEQFKGVAVAVQSETLSEADKLNGYEWKGSMTVSYRLSRTHWKSRGWGDWSMAGGNFKQYALDKKRGVNHCDFAEALTTNYRKVPCSAVPQ